MHKKDDRYVKIKINGDKTNKEKGFFLLLDSGSPFSSKEKDEFVVKRKTAEKIHKKGIDLAFL